MIGVLHYNLLNRRKTITIEVTTNEALNFRYMSNMPRKARKLEKIATTGCGGDNDESQKKR